MLLMGDATKNNESKLMKIYQLPKLYTESWSSWSKLILNIY